MTDAIRLEEIGGVARLTVNRPHVRNALDTAAWRSLRAALESVAAGSPHIRVLVIRGEGEDVFVSGADLKEMGSVRAAPRRLSEYIALVESVMSTIELLPQAVIAMVNGSAVGAGTEIMAASDIRVARAGIRLGIPAAKLGVAITDQDIHRLERNIGLARTRWLLLTGETISAEQAATWGFVQMVCEAPDLEPQVMALAERISLNSPASIQMMKASMADRSFAPEGDPAAGFRRALESWSGNDAAEGLRAHRERRKAHFGALWPNESGGAVGGRAAPQETGEASGTLGGG